MVDMGIGLFLGNCYRRRLMYMPVIPQVMPSAASLRLLSWHTKEITLQYSRVTRFSDRPLIFALNIK